MVITEFDCRRSEDPEATLHALADEILKYRRAVRLLAKVIGWADAGAPFAIIAPGPYWRPPAVLKVRIDLRVHQLKLLAAWTAVNWRGRVEREERRGLSGCARHLPR